VADRLSARIFGLGRARRHRFPARFRLRLTHGCAAAQVCADDAHTRFPHM
jgi:hypothetical protein